MYIGFQSQKKPEILSTPLGATISRIIDPNDGNYGPYTKKCTQYIQFQGLHGLLDAMTRLYHK